MTLLQNWLSRSAHDWGISPRTAILLFLLPLAAGALLFLTWMRRDLFVFILAEDSIVEWLSAATFAGAAVFAAVLAWRRYRADGWRHTLLFGSIAALMAGLALLWGVVVFYTIWRAPRSRSRESDDAYRKRIRYRE